MQNSSKVRLRRKYSDYQVSKILELLRQGKGSKQVAIELSIPYSTVYTLAKKHNLTRQYKVKESEESAAKNDTGLDDILAQLDKIKLELDFIRKDQGYLADLYKGFLRSDNLKKRIFGSFFK